MSNVAGFLDRFGRLREAGAHAETVEATRVALAAAPPPDIPRSTLLHAFGLAVADWPEAPADLLAEAVRALETSLTTAPAAESPLLDALGSIAEPLAACLQRRRASPDAPPAPADDGDALLVRLVAEAKALVSGGEFAPAAALLARAADGTAAPGLSGALEARPAAQAARTVGRSIDAYLEALRDLDPPGVDGVVGELMERYSVKPGRELGDVTPAGRARRRVSDVHALAFAAPEQAYAYLHHVVDFGGAAAAARRPELERRMLEPALFVARALAGDTRDLASEAAITLIFARGAADAGAAADAYLATEALRRRCEAAPGGAPWLAAVRAVLGITLIARGERDEGRRLAREAVGAVSASDHPDIHTDVLHWLYVADLDAFDADGAVACHDALAAVGRADGTSRQEAEARAAEQADPEGAARRYQALLSDPAAREPGGAFTLDTAWRVVPRLARLALDAGHWQFAQSLCAVYYPGLLGTREPDHPSVSDVEELLADVALAAGRPRDAIAYLARAASRDSRLIARRLAVSTSRRRQALLAGPRRRADALVALAAEFACDDRDAVTRAFVTVMQRKGLNTNVERQAARDVAAWAARDPDVRALQERLAAVRARITRLALALTRDASGDAVELEALAAEEERLGAELLVRVDGVTITPAAEWANPLPLTMCTPRGSVYVEFVRHEPPRRPGDRAPRLPRYAAFVFPSHTMEWRLVDLGEAGPADDLVRQFRTAVTGVADGDRDAVLDPEDGDGRSGTSDGDPARAGVPLRRRIFDPLIALFGGRTRLIVSPDAALWALPLECLPTDGGGHLIEQYCISYASSAWSVSSTEADSVARPRSTDQGPAQDVAVVIGAPDYDLGAAPLPSSAFRFPPLPGTRAEAETAAAAFGVAPALDAAGTAARLREARRPFAVHLATHGFALPASTAGGRLAGTPLLRTGLAFAGANARPAAGGDAGVLTANEVASLDLRGTELVVLSACKTGLGEVDRGEGLASLGRAFEAAGATRVVAGLWSVPDAETRDLMAAFYDRLTPARGVAVALHEAKLEMRRRFVDVRRWGAFVCIGRWGPVALRPSDPPAPHP